MSARNPVLLALTLLVAPLPPATAQLTEAWVQSDTTFAGHAFGSDASGRTVVAGGSISGSFARAVVRGADGTTLFTATIDLGAGTQETFGAPRFAANGDLVLLGEAANATTFAPSLMIVRYDAGGNLLWSRVTTSPPNGFEDPANLAIAPNGDLVVVGSRSDGTSGEDAAVWRFDGAGNPLWSASIAGSQGRPDGLASIAFAPNGDICLAGTANAYPPVNTDVLVARVSGAGAVLWFHEYSAGANLECGRGVVVDAAGRIVVAATIDTATASDSALLVYDAAGSLLQTLASGHARAVATGLTIRPQGDVILLSGTYDASSVQGYDLRAYDGSFGLEWSVQRAATWARGFLVEPGGEILVHGAVYAPHPYADAFATRYGRDGSALWTVSYGAAGASGTEAIAAASMGPGECLFAHDSTAFVASVRRFERGARAVCFGDGSGAACPCANASAASERAGCRSSLGTGDRLESAGAPRLSAPTLRLDATALPAASVLLFQGTAPVAAGAGAAFGDGLRCASGTVVRLATRTAVAGAVSYPAAGDPPLPTTGLITGPATRWYQAWYRNSAAFCTSATFNLTNALLVDWSG